MKKYIMFLTLGLLAAGAFAVDTPKSDHPGGGSGSGAGASPAVTVTDKIESLSLAEFRAVTAERDLLRNQLQEAVAVATTLKNQRNELASTVLDLTSQVAAMQQEIARLRQPPMTNPPPPAPATPPAK